MDLTSPIVVGVSRRTCSPDAVRWAAAEAQLRDTRVIAVTAWRGPRPPGGSGGRPPAILAPVEEAFALEEQRIADQLTELLGDLASFRVEYALRRGSAAAVLLAASVGAQLLVLDSPRGGNLSTLAKSLIAPQVLFKAPCPVVLMPPATDGAPDLVPGGSLTSA
jgi:nucleotide-binding universal stress UspA family protein